MTNVKVVQPTNQQTDKKSICPSFATGHKKKKSNLSRVMQLFVVNPHNILWCKNKKKKKNNIQHYDLFFFFFFQVVLYELLKATQSSSVYLTTLFLGRLSPLSS